MKITVQDYRRTQTKHRKAKKGHGWTKLERIEMDYIWVNLKKRRSTFFLNLCQFISKYHLHSGKIILSCYVALILQMKDSCSANLTFNLGLIIGKIKQNYLK